MQKIILDDPSFWKWMETTYSVPSEGVNDYLRLIAENEIDKGYLVELLSEKIPESHSSIMTNLRQRVPYQYFLEIQTSLLVSKIVKRFRLCRCKTARGAFINGARRMVTFNNPQRCIKNMSRRL